ncbi:MAG: glutaminyl-peptide cyclotransferase [Corynebacterium sp.]|nr:glutaminyl-peptide cyclotransferase [Corynebacterium sp.]
MRLFSVSLWVLASTSSLLLSSCTEPTSTPLEPSQSAAPTSVTNNSDETSAASTQPVQQLQATVNAAYPFDSSLFVQGLEVTPSGDLLVGTGMNGESGLFRITPGEGKAQEINKLDEHYFGEGIAQTTTAANEDVVWQLTWKNGEAFKYDASTFALVDTAHFAGEGWGLCSLDAAAAPAALTAQQGTRDAQVLALSDGTPTIRFMDPDTFAEQGSITVTFNDEPVTDINELECAGDHIYANVWMTDQILRIDPATGTVTATIDTSAAANNAAGDVNNVLNGIAAIPNSDEFYITGKRWPDLYRVRFEPAA